VQQEQVPSVFSIHSSSSSRELVFQSRKGENFQVILKGNVEAATDVWAYTDAQGLNNLFQELGTYQKPWKGKKEWQSIEGEFSISATCSSLGEVQLWVELRGLQGAPEEWKVHVGLVTEFGQLEKIAKEAMVFFS